MEEWSVLDQLLDAEGYHSFRIVKDEDGFHPQHYNDSGWIAYSVSAYKTPKEAMEYLLKQPLEL